MIVRVRYHVATYSGIVRVSVEPEDDNETIAAKARGQLRRQCGGELPFGSQSFRVLRDGEPDLEPDDPEEEG